MEEKKGGLRQMMHMSGLTSFQYYAGLFLGDFVLFFGPAVVISIALIPFEEVMVRSQIFSFFISYLLYGAALINLAYAFSHIFSNPDTGGKYLAIIFLLGFLFGPIAISLILAAIIGFESSVSNTLSFWYFVDPTLCFMTQLYNLCVADKSFMENWQIKIFTTITPTTGLYCGVMFY